MVDLLINLDSTFTDPDYFSNIAAMLNRTALIDAIANLNTAFNDATAEQHFWSPTTKSLANAKLAIIETISETRVEIKAYMAAYQKTRHDQLTALDQAKNIHSEATLLNVFNSLQTKHKSKVSNHDKFDQ